MQYMQHCWDCRACYWVLLQIWPGETATHSGAGVRKCAFKHKDYPPEKFRRGLLFFVVFFFVNINLSRPTLSTKVPFNRLFSGNNWHNQKPETSRFFVFGKKKKEKQNSAQFLVFWSYWKKQIYSLLVGGLSVILCFWLANVLCHLHLGCALRY